MRYNLMSAPSASIQIPGSSGSWLSLPFLFDNDEQAETDYYNGWMLDKMKEDLAARFLELSDNLSRSGAVSREDVLDIFFAEIGIIIGSGLQKAVEPDFDLRGGIIARMKCYLQGFRQSKRDKGEK